MENNQRAGEQRAGDQRARDQHAERSRTGADGRRYSSTRERILREIESRGAASTADLVAATGLHENTVRGHLERLRDDGRIRRVRAESLGRGRPAWRWEAPRADAVDPYAGLALALADTLVRVAADPVAQARLSGSEWGAQIAQEREADAAEPHALVMDVMREQGFAPQSRGDHMVLHRCPLLAAAARRSDVVCAVHEGMVEGIARARADGADARLQPFQADGGGCVLHLRVAP